MTLDVVVIHPGAQKRIYGTLAERQTALEPPPWTRMIAGWLRDRDYTIAIVDQEAEGLTSAQVTERVLMNTPGLVVIVVFGHQPSASTQQMTGAHEVASMLHGKVRTIMVGNHPSALPERTLCEEPVNFVCDGEGPVTIAGLLKKTKREEIPGLVWCVSRGEVHRNRLASLLPIDALHGDVWDLLPMNQYRAHTWQCLDGSPRQPYASVYTTLGCPFRCSFCMINVFQHTNLYRMRDPKQVVAQIEHLYQSYGVRTLKIADEMFVLNEHHYTTICEGLAALPFADELNIWAYARVDTIKPHTLALLRRAGIRWLALGIESGSAHVRDGAEKHLEDDDIRKVVVEIHRAGISVIGNFIFGLPDDTNETMETTLVLAKSLDLEFANFYSAMAYPGSRLYDQTMPEDLPALWSGYSQHAYETRPLPTATLSSVDVLRFRDEAFHNFFTDPIYLERLDRKFGSAAVQEIELMTEQRLSRQLLVA